MAYGGHVSKYHYHQNNNSLWLRVYTPLETNGRNLIAPLFFPFELTKAVLVFDRVSTFLTVFCRWVLVLLIHDFSLLAKKDHAVRDGMKLMQERSELFDIVLDARKDQGLCLVLPFLENLDDYSKTSFVGLF